MTEPTPEAKREVYYYKCILIGSIITEIKAIVLANQTVYTPEHTLEIFRLLETLSISQLQMIGRVGNYSSILEELFGLYEFNADDYDI